MSRIARISKVAIAVAVATVALGAAPAQAETAPAAVEFTSIGGAGGLIP